MTEPTETPVAAPLMPVPEPSPAGIGGWLLLPVLHLLLDVVLFFGVFVNAVSPQLSDAAATPDGSGAAVAVTESGVASMAFLGLLALIVVYAIYCLVRFFQKKRQVPALMIGFYVLIIAKAVLNLALLRLYPDLVTAPSDMTDAWRGIAQALIAGAIWIQYFRVSERVENTFVR